MGALAALAGRPRDGELRRRGRRRPLRRARPGERADGRVHGGPHARRAPGRPGILQALPVQHQAASPLHPHHRAAAPRTFLEVERQGKRPRRPVPHERFPEAHERRRSPFSERRRGPFTV